MEWLTLWLRQVLRIGHGSACALQHWTLPQEAWLAVVLPCPMPELAVLPSDLPAGRLAGPAAAALLSYGCAGLRLDKRVWPYPPRRALSRRAARAAPTLRWPSPLPTPPWWEVRLDCVPSWQSATVRVMWCALGPLILHALPPASNCCTVCCGHCSCRPALCGQP